MDSSSKVKPSGIGSIPFKVAITYFLVGALWILFSDKALGLMVRNPAMLTTVSIIKGWFFVTVTALLLYAMIGRWALRVERSQEEVRLSEAKYRKLVESANSIILRVDNLGCITFINEFTERFFGFTEEELIGKNVVGTIVPRVETGGRDLRTMVEDAMDAPERYTDNIDENIRKNGERVWIAWTSTPLKDENGRVTEVLCVGSDITERKQAEEERELVVEFLRLVNESENTHELVYEATAFFQKRSGCEAAGIRLKREQDYPYYETRGFSPEFVRLENNLCTRGKDGLPVLDTAGYPVLECMCGNVISARFDPSKPFFTSNGSFWTNGTTELLATTTEADRQARTRNRCNGEGYESVALIALCAGEEKIGLLQLNDRRKDRFTPQSIALWERLSSYLSVALSKFIVQEALAESENRYRELFEAGSDAILFVDNDTERILDVNTAASSMLGYSREELLAKKNWELSVEPEETRQRTRGAKDVCGQVITVPLRHLRKKDGTVFQVEITGRSFLSGNRSVFIAAIRDITERKKAEEEKARLAAIVESSTDAIIGKTLGGTITSWNMGAQNIYQYTAREVIGQSVKIIVPGGLSDEVDAILEKVKAGEPVESYETVRRRKDGRELQVSLTVSPIRDGYGNIIGASSVARDITSQKRVRDALRESEARMKSIFQAAPIGIGLTSKRVIVDANEQLCKIVGYSRDEVIGRQAKILYPDYEEYDYVGVRLYGQIRKQGTGTVETRFRRKDGEIIDVLLNSTPIDPANLAFGVTFTVLDITGQKRAQDEFNRLFQQNKLILDAAQEGIIGLDLSGKVTFANPAAAKTLGYSIEELLGEDLHLLAHHTKYDGEPYSEDACPMNRTLRTGLKSRVKDEILYRKDGAPFHAAYSTSPIEENGAITGAVVNFRDITGRLLAQESLIESERRYRALFENMASGFVLFEVVVDSRSVPVDLVILTANKGFEATTGLKTSEVAGKRLTQVLPGIEKDDADWIGRYGKVALTGEVLQFEQRSELLGVYYSVTAYQAGPGQCCVTFQDITERKHSEEERTLIEAQLRQAQKMEALGTLAGGIAHDFNNILGVISGFTELTLMDQEDKDQVRENLGEVLKASVRARDLVKQILAFSRQSSQEKKPVQVGLIVKEVLKMLRASLPATIEIKHDVASRAVVSADPTHIHQVLMNLCTNGSHAMSDAGGVLDVSLTDVTLGPDSIRGHERLRPGPYVELCVSDTGQGIEPSILERIFDPFFTTKEQGVGTGLGLAVVHGIAQSLGGFVDVRSVIGKGTTFSVFFPTMEISQAAPREESSPLPGGKERILIVDDEPALAEALRRMLERLGYTVELGSSGKEALEAFERQAEERPFDLVITDMTMPHMTGAELAREILNLRPDQPIILCTGFSEKIDVEKAKALGVRGFVMKPVVLKDLAGLVRKTLDTKGGI